MWRELMWRADALHPVALVAVVVVLLALGYSAGLVLEPALVATVIALVALVKAAAVLAAVALAGRRVVDVITRYFDRRAVTRGYPES
jgi:hypothetical protein